MQIAGESTASVKETQNKVEAIFGHSVHLVLVVEGQVRPGKEKGHEHFVRCVVLFLPFSKGADV